MVATEADIVGRCPDTEPPHELEPATPELAFINHQYQPGRRVWLNSKRRMLDVDLIPQTMMIGPEGNQHTVSYVTVDQEGKPLPYRHITGRFFMLPDDITFGQLAPLTDEEVLDHLKDKKDVHALNGINDLIHHQAYRPQLVMGDSEHNKLVESPYFAEGMFFSLYMTLREWMKKEYPDDFKKIVEKAQVSPEQVLGDTLHVILPLLVAQKEGQGKRDVDLLMKIGREAIIEDLGIAPEGIWLPETAVSTPVLQSAQEAGYRYIVLKDNQIKFPEGQAAKNPVWVKLPNGKEIAIVHSHTGLGGSVAFDEKFTSTTEEFISHVKDLQQATGTTVTVVSADGETYGHHHKRKEHFVAHSSQRKNMQANGFRPLNIQAKLDMPDEEKQYVEIYENSSWGCMHALGRWTGDAGCNCNGENHALKGKRKEMYETLMDYNGKLNERLDQNHAGWEREFIETFLATRSLYYTGEDIEPLLEKLIPDAEKRNLFKAKMDVFYGLTSCGWYFDGEDRIELQIPQSQIEEIEWRFPEFTEKQQSLPGEGEIFNLAVG